MLTPEQALNALQASLQTSLGTTFQSYGRRLRPWTETTMQQPALFLQHESTEGSWENDSIDQTILVVKAWLFTKTGLSDTPSTLLNALVAALETALAADDDNSQQFTLGRTVSWCRIDGTTEFYPGDLGDQAIAVVPLKILLTL